MRKKKSREKKKPSVCRALQFIRETFFRNELFVCAFF